ncbi:MAG: tRNA uridine-5-carboxymethylaminomethyl(34) synthesis GTPase MnmE [Dinoroseobacter sp.]|nr:tRNA uridine-5-carboxymethylaminomethyl(34) synthesis GTPase MnmE [Dinoroseobacter sp.]
METIFAQATAKGKAGVAVVRISGPQAFSAARQIARPLPDAHRAGLRSLRDQNGGLLDEALVLTFPEGRSFTGEEVVELQLHGSTAVVSAVLRTLAAIDGLRLAEPGEFTRRAMENNRLDLAQVEGLADLVEAETEAQRLQAQRVFSGALGDKVEAWRAKLIRAAALLEATIDFADEEVPEDVSPEVKYLLTSVATDLASEIKGSVVAERVRDGFEVAILGAPNAGKSSLLNALAGREAAITSSIAGTTRDVIEVRMDLGGVPVTLLDTAGLRETEDEIEQIGVERALSRADQADLSLVLTETGELPVELRETKVDLVVRTKCDLRAPKDGLAISTVTGQGLQYLTDEIGRLLSDRVASVGTATHLRHRVSMEKASANLAKVLEQLDSEVPTEILADELRTAIRALDSLIGRVDVDHLLGEIFASFCIGK